MFKVFVGFLLTAGMVPFFIFDPGHFPTALKMTRTLFKLDGCLAFLLVVPVILWGLKKDNVQAGGSKNKWYSLSPFIILLLKCK